jgi:hypothetical protein
MAGSPTRRINTTVVTKPRLKTILVATNLNTYDEIAVGVLAFQTDWAGVGVVQSR